jgi:Xaa-Pro aminopeptidase
MKKKNCGRYVLSKLDDIMWLLNIRGGDIECNPVALSYFVLTSDAAFLFIREREVTDALKDHLAKYSVTLRPYEEAGKFLAAYSGSGKTLFDGLDTSYSFYNTIKSRSEYVDAMNPTSIRKAVKNPTELENIRRVYIEDSATLTKFIFWLKKNAGKTPLTEYSAAMRLDGMRAKIKGFMDLSFPTISAYNANAAMMHYEATENDCADIKAEGMLLVDSGGQYLGGTTDVTRTIVLGKISDETKKHFTKVAIGMLNLANTHFLYGCSGRNVDIMAREPLWELGIDYKCGTGHGIGYILNVHEGPQNIRWHYNIDQPEATLEEGMIVSDEPGVYLEGKYGIRTENILEIKKGIKNGDGQFMHFDMLTYVPIDKDAIDVSVMEDKDIERLNAYHKAVYEKLHPFMSGEDEEMLKAATAPVSRS